MNKNTLLACLLALWAGVAAAHGGEDHGDGAKPAAISASDKPQRLPDGRVFLPKDAQRRLGLRTVLGAQQAVPKSVELNGHVVMDPNFGGRVQATQGGRIEPGPNGLPVPGMKVRRGQVLAYVTPALNSAERASQQAELAELRVKAQLAAQQLKRLQELAGTVSRKELETQAAELSGLRQRATALARGAGREALRAPAAGVIASAKVVNGQVVEARDVLFEVIDPARLMVEALAYDSKLVAGLASASLADSRSPLALVGGANAMRDGALPVLFRLQQAGEPPLALGQTVKVVAHTRDSVQGVPLPASSVVKNAANENVVWLHEQAELFRAAAVQVQALDGANVVAVGLKPGVRVVSSGATLINQIR